MALKELMARGIQGTTSQAHAGAGGGAKTASAEQAAQPIRTQAPGPRTVAPSTSVDATSELEGRLRCKETLRIDGRIEGEIDCDKTVIVGEGARVFARIDADEVQVSGIVEGNITAGRKITLEATAVVVGDLTTPGIVIQEGAKLKGRILIGSDAGAEETVASTKDAKAEADRSRPAESSTTAAPDGASSPDRSSGNGGGSPGHHRSSKKKHSSKSNGAQRDAASGDPLAAASA